MAHLQNWIDGVVIFDAVNSNPNGDPDMEGGAPRQELGTDRGLVSDVAIKRMIRKYIDVARDHEPSAEGLGIMMQEGAVLNAVNDEALEKAGVDVPERGKAKSKDVKATAEQVAAARAVLCANYWDVRAFGAVLTRGGASDKVTGPIQMGFARSIDRIDPQRHTITRVAATDESENKENKTMGAKTVVPYGMYRAEFSVSASQAAKTGFSEADVALLIRSLTDGWRHNASAARAQVRPVAVVTWRHDHALGNAPVDVLQDTLRIERIAGDPMQAATGRSDYRISIDESAVPAGVTVEVHLMPREPKVSEKAA